jgi:hypothetical protein
MSTLISRNPECGRDVPQRGERRSGGVGAYRQSDLGDFEDVMILKVFGEVPDDFST